jgi:phosphoglucosamine mutase
MTSNKHTSRAKVQFGTDGIRGVAGQYPLDPATVLRIGRALGRWLREHKASSGKTPQAILGRDTRVSGGMIANTLALGLLSEGIDVVDRGVISTPGVAYLTTIRHFDLGVVVSASHNPVEQNGIKVFGGDGYKLNDAEEARIETLIETIEDIFNDTHFADYASYAPGYSQYELDMTVMFDDDPLDNWRVALDCANGAASAVAPDAFRRAGCAGVYPMNHQPSGFNINVNAGSEQVRRDSGALLGLVRAQNADIGFAFDGDADRVVCITPDGMLIDGDHILGVLAVELKAQGQLRKNTVVATEMSNSGLEDYLRGQGITMLRTKVGDRHVMQAMRQNGLTLGGEQAGHIIIFDETRTAGDGVYTALYLSALLARNKREGGPTLSQLAKAIPRYPQVIASAHLNRQTDLAAVPGLDELHQETLAQFGGKGRLNLRFSGTEPNVFRVMVEGVAGSERQQVVDCALKFCNLVATATQTDSPRIDLVDG